MDNKLTYSVSELLSRTTTDYINQKRRCLDRFDLVKTVSVQSEMKSLFDLHSYRSCKQNDHNRIQFNIFPQ